MTSEVVAVLVCLQTTLLTALAGRASYGTLSGKVTINGRCVYVQAGSKTWKHIARTSDAVHRHWSAVTRCVVQPALSVRDPHATASGTDTDELHVFLGPQASVGCSLTALN